MAEVIRLSKKDIEVLENFRQKMIEWEKQVLGGDCSAEVAYWQDLSYSDLCSRAFSCAFYHAEDRLA